jgi:hypothetical protein
MVAVARFATKSQSYRKEQLVSSFMSTGSWIALSITAWALTLPHMGAHAATLKTELCPYSPTATERSNSDEIESILKPIPLTASWKDLPTPVKTRLAELANQRLLEFRHSWGAQALSNKEYILLHCPVEAMRANEDRYYRLSYNNIVSESFSVKDIKSAALRDALVMNYLGSYAAIRSMQVYPDNILLNLDWDGVSLFDSVRLPDEVTYNEIMAYNAKVRKTLAAIPDNSLSHLDKQVKEFALYDARAHAYGAFSADGYGGFDMQSPCEAMQRDWDIDSAYQADKGRPRIFETDASALIEVNALFSDRVHLRWIDVGTVDSATKFCDSIGPDDIKHDVGDPASNEVAKGLILMKRWWFERLSETPDAKNKCSRYTEADRAAIWEAFSADMHFNNDGSSSMKSQKAQLERYRGDRINSYHALAKAALNDVFPDNSILAADERVKVDAAIDSDDSIGSIFSTMSMKLDMAHGHTDGPAALHWREIASEKVVRIGGGYRAGDPVRPGDKALLESMFEEVKTWIAARYKGYPIDIASLYPHITLTVTTANNAFTRVPGDVTFGIGTSRSKYEYYSLLIHELRHAVAYSWERNSPDRSKVQYDLGTAMEGSGVAVEDLLLRSFAKDTLKDETALTLDELDYGIRDARFIGTTDATLQKYFLPECADGDDTIVFAEKVAQKYGLTGVLSSNAAVRAHAGTQYFQYVLGGLQVLEEIDYLQKQIDPTKVHLIDPYVLFACGLNTPQKDAKYVSSLRTCMKL